MAEKTGIAWATATWNPWYGCKKVSTGCARCYMFRDMARFGREPKIVQRASPASFNVPLTWERNGKVEAGARIFTCSWSDWFIDKADEWRPEAWEIVKATPQFTYLVLTKRPERILAHLPPDWGEGYPNVILMVSAENQKYADKRIPILLSIPARYYGVSAEPLLGPIDFTAIRSGDEQIDALRSEAMSVKTDRVTKDTMRWLDWVITGGESDQKAPRPCDLDWVRSIRDQCVKTETAFFHKQHGGSKKIDGAWGGYLLDGKTWQEFP